MYLLLNSVKSSLMFGFVHSTQIMPWLEKKECGSCGSWDGDNAWCTGVYAKYQLAANGNDLVHSTWTCIFMN